ncbi:MAG: FKBP-type peptidyl-prolyl cis-trans isomerase [Bacteroidetes bacterium]|nr:FKBP-type peptidyl-prolyl cis-trans isomerase [Bacteroidota bacterium]HET6244936.1 FKBP-type peptidyl-prolyl cis-trans isomerase [Bacteroidia bacterium]
MSKYTRYSFCLLIVVFSSCFSKPQGFLQTSSGLKYKFFHLGTGNLPKQFDYLRIKYQAIPINQNKNSIAVTHEKFFQLNFNYPESLIEEALTMLNKGDSAAFIFPFDEAARFFIIDSVGKPKKVILNIKIVEIIPAEKYLKHQIELKEWVNHKSDHEHKILKKYIKENNISESSYSDGIYLIFEKKGEGKKITQGMKVSINYRGSFLNGEVFDDTFADKKSFDLTLGTSEQVISGLEIAIKKMNNGGKAKIIIPSHFGFGESGSSTGIIPPNTTLIYEVEILRVNN